ncbi:MAG: glycosyltransferase family 39 protein [Polyangiaceae bacterium]|nr:glycosyltransferase family 39 protein [Polyangiaceae bacterium]
MQQGDDEAAPAAAERDSPALPAERAGDAPAEPGAASLGGEGSEERAARPSRADVGWGALAFVLGALPVFLLMCTERRWSFSVPVGFVGCSVAALGAMRALGAFRTGERQERREVGWRAVRGRLFELLASAVALIAVLRVAVAGTLPAPRLSSAVLVTGAFLWCVVAGFRVAEALGVYGADERGEKVPIHRRHGFWLVALITLVYLPLLGSYSLSDPWETHYGEVAREMLSRDDWISLWWAQEGWFWSKPILNFWSQGLAFSLLGVRFLPDQMLSTVAQGRLPQPEWAARMPVFLLTLSSHYLFYRGLASAFGRRAGFLGSLVLACLPYWYLIAHQTMADMPYVAPLTGGMGLLLWGMNVDPERRLPAVEIPIGKRRLVLSAQHLVFYLVALLVIPQVLYLASRHFTLLLPPKAFGFLAPHLDQFFSGSGEGNCGLPGNEACRDQRPVHPAVQPGYAAVGWLALLGMFLWTRRGELRTQRVLYLGGWLLVTLAAMAKGAPGLVLPVAAVLAWVFVTRRWRELERLELPALLLLVAVIVLPWYVQMYLRHGEPFTDRLLFHDMYKRAFVHVHDTNTGDDVSFRYYVWQLGYGLFPLTGLVAAGLLDWLRRRDAETTVPSQGAALLVMWFVAGFGMFTITLTKFHHYVLPVVPPAAALTGVLLDRALADGALPRGRSLAAYLAAITACVVLLVYGVLRLLPGTVLGAVPAGGLPAPTPWLGVAVAALGLAGLVAIVVWQRRASAAAITDPEHDPTGAPAPSPGEQASHQAAMGVLGLGAAVATVLAGRDLVLEGKSDPPGQARLMQLFTYNYRRPFPESLDFDAMLLGFTVVAAVFCLLLIARSARVHAVVGSVVLGVLASAWGVNVYLFRCAPHWGQRETALAYYQDRTGPEEPFVSYQMNWKGENFYSGNRTPAFVSSGQKFKDWVKEQRAKGVKRMYFTTEHGRMGSLKGELENPPKLEVITTKELNNKFMTVRAEW